MRLRRPLRAALLLLLLLLAAVAVAACGGGGGADDDPSDWVVVDVFQEGDTWFVEYKPPDGHLARTAVGTGEELTPCARQAIPGELVPDCVHEFRAATDDP